MELTFLTNEIINFFAPEHQSLSCNEEKPENDWLNQGLVKCSRCYLLNAKKWKYHNQNKHRFWLIIEEINDNTT